jgi:hypothetical protein
MQPQEIEQPKFVVSFDMKSEYTYQGKTYEIRLGAHRRITRPDYFPMVMKCIGTVMHRDTSTTVGSVHTFPEPEIVEMFSKFFEVRLVGARWTPSFSDIEWDSKQPDLYEDEDNETVYVKEYIAKFRDWPKPA